MTTKDRSSEAHASHILSHTLHGTPKNEMAHITSCMLHQTAKLHTLYPILCTKLENFGYMWHKTTKPSTYLNKQTPLTHTC